MSQESDYRVSVVGPEEAAEVLARLRPHPENKGGHRAMALAGGLEVKGSFELIARDAESGEVAWEHKDDNLITDFGRRWWMDSRFNNIKIGFAPSTEAPTSSRYTMPSDVAQMFASGNLSPSNNSSTNTKTVSATFGTPGVNRTLGQIHVLRFNETAPDTGGWQVGLVAYALLTPPKTQTTTQTLEVVYKISMSPIY